MESLIGDKEEEILEAVLRLQGKSSDFISTSKVKRIMSELSGHEIKQTTLINTISRKLASPKFEFLEFQPYKGVRLTEKGKKYALRITRHHRIAERLLVDILGFDWIVAHDEACLLEHALSPQVAERIQNILKENSRKKCPHGLPIPSKDGKITIGKYKPLIKVDPPKKVILRQVQHGSRDVLEKVNQLGIRLDDEFNIVTSTKIQIKGKQVQVSSEILRNLFVEILNNKEYVA